MKTIHIVGGGITGCSLAYFLKNKFNVVIYEKKNKLGGLCSTEYNMEGIPFQKGAHVLHTNEGWIVELISKSIPLKTVDYQVGINPLFDTRCYSFPFSKETIDHMPWHWKEAIKLDLQKTQGDFSTVSKELLVNYYGETIYQIFYKNYLKKIFRSDENINLEWIQKLIKPINSNSKYYLEQTYFPINRGYNDLFDFLTKNVEVCLNSEITLKNLPKNDIIICSGRGDYFLSGEETTNYIKCSFDVDSNQYNINAPDTTIYPNYTPFISITQFGKFFPKYTKNIIVKDFPNCGEEVFSAEIKNYYDKAMPNIFFAGRQGTCQMLDMADCIKQANFISATIKLKEKI